MANQYETSLFGVDLSLANHKGLIIWSMITLNDFEQLNDNGDLEV